MSVKSFKNIVELKKFVDKQVQQAMMKNGNVKQLVIDTAERHVQEDVYDVYSPTVYERTGELKTSWTAVEIDNGISVINARTDDETGANIAEIVETGKGYKYDFEYSGVPRPFIENTREELRSRKGEVVQVMKKDLKASGINVQ